jgi:hypothetical protein
MDVGYGKAGSQKEGTASIFYAKSVWELIG